MGNIGPQGNCSSRTCPPTPPCLSSMPSAAHEVIVRATNCNCMCSPITSPFPYPGTYRPHQRFSPICPAYDALSSKYLPIATSRPLAPCPPRQRITRAELRLDDRRFGIAHLLSRHRSRPYHTLPGLEHANLRRAVIQRPLCDHTSRPPLPYTSSLGCDAASANLLTSYRDIRPQCVTLTSRSVDDRGDLPVNRESWYAGCQ